MTRLPLIAILLACPVAASAMPSHRHHPGKIDRSRAGSAVVAAANAAGTAEPVLPAFINASATMPFVDGTIYRVYTAPERVTDIVLQPGEVLGSVAAGDTARWVIGDTSSGSGPDKRAHVLVKPFAVGLETNLVITTDRRTYHVAMTSSARAAMSEISWSYPQDALIALKRSQDQAATAVPVAGGLDVDQLHFNYAISGDRPAWRPLRAFDDGRQTFIEFPEGLATGEAPPLFLTGPKGEAQLVNYRVRGPYYVVDRLFDAAELRLGAKRQDIVRIARIGNTKSRRRNAARAS